jgi:hypothetical protein
MSGSPSQFKIDAVEGALIALLNTVMPAAYALALNPDGVPGPDNTVISPPPSVKIDVATVNSKDFNAQGQLAIKPPSLRVQFAEAEFSDLRDNQRLTYESGLLFDVLCFESSLRSKADERLQIIGLVDVALNQLAGARLALSDGTSSMPITLKRVSLVIPNDDGPVDQLFAITILIKGIAQYNGPNARFGS